MLLFCYYFGYYTAGSDEAGSDGVGSSDGVCSVFNVNPNLLQT